MMGPTMTDVLRLELLQGVIAVVGTAFNIIGLRNAILDGIFLHASGKNGPRMLIVDSRIRQETLNLAVQMTLVMISSLSLLLPPPLPDDALMLGFTIERVALMAITIMLALRAALDTRESARLRTWKRGGDRRCAPRDDDDDDCSDHIHS